MSANLNHSDEQLFRDLEAFGQTLESETGERLRPPAEKDDLSNATSLDGSGSLGVGSQASRVRRPPIGWLAVAAAVMVVAVSVVTLRSRGAEQNLTADTQPDDSAELIPFSVVGPSEITDKDGNYLASIEYTEPEGDAPVAIKLLDDEVGSDRINLDYAEQALQEMYDNQDFWDAVDLTEATEYQWLGQGGLQIRTNFDPDLQRSAAAAVKSSDVNTDGIESQVVTVDVDTGSVVAFYGLGLEKIDLGGPAEDERRRPPRPVQRPLGSAMYPIVVAEAYAQGYTPNDGLSGSSPCAFYGSGEDEPWQVAGPSFENLTIEGVVAESSRCGAVRLGYAVGGQNLLRRAQSLGFGVDDAYPSLPLGAFTVEPVDVVGAYLTFANSGMHIQPWYVSEVSVGSAQVVVEHESTQAVTPETAALVDQTLRFSMENGSGRFRAQLESRPSAGKSGTTQNNADGWFVGYTPQYATGVWAGGADDVVGNQKIVDDRVLVGPIQPGALWHEHMTTIHEGLPVEEFDAVAEPARAPKTIEVAEEVEVVSGE